MTDGHSHLDPAAISRLTMNAEPWMSCDDCFDQIDSYLDGVLAGHSGVSPGLCAHLIGCSACFAEAWSLLLLAATDQGIDPDQALMRMRTELDCTALAWPEHPIDGHQRRTP